MRYDSRLFRLFVAFLAAGLALLLRQLADSVAGTQTLWLCSILGVVFSAWYGGLKPGLVTTALLLVAGLWFEPPLPAAAVPALSAILFTCAALAICAAMQRLRTEHFTTQTTSARLHDVLESTQDAILSLDNEFRCLYANARAGQIAKRHPSLLHGKSLRTIFPETPAVIVYRELQRALREGAPVHFEDRAGTSGRWYEFKAYPVPAGLNLFVSDITARKVTEAQRSSVTRARELEYVKLESVLREMPVGVIITSTDMHVELINSAAEGLFGAGIQPGDDLREKMNGRFETLGGESVDTSQGPVSRALRNGDRVPSQELVYTHTGGRSITLIVSAIPLRTPDGSITGALGTYLDVTSLRQTQKALVASESRLRRLFDNPMIGLVSGDEEKVLDANDAWLAIVGYTREELNRGELKWASLNPPEFHEMDMRARAQLARRGFCDPVEKELIAKDGRRVGVLTGTATYGDSHWSPWLAWVFDLSDRRRLENRLREAGKLESIGLLAGGIAHDFNNILTSVLGNVSLAFESLQPRHPTRPLLENAIRSTERAADLTRQLLAYAGKGQVLIRAIDMTSLTREIGQLIRSSIPRNVELELDLASGLPLVEGDMTQLQQLIMNLVINGAEAVGDDPGMVRVVTESVHASRLWLLSQEIDQDFPDGAYVSIEVHDNGCGMSAETRQRIFDPFFTTKFTGRGLGLAAANGIVRAHKGVMKVSSTPGRGSIFRVLLPARGNAGAQCPPPPERFPEAESVVTADQLRCEGTIMVVDDEAMVREVAKSALERHGYTVLTAADGREALALYRGLSHGISMVILDMTMPRMSGEETLGNLMAMNPAARILLTSGFDEAETVQRLSDRNLAGFLQKPYTAACLIAKVRGVLETGGTGEVAAPPPVSSGL